MNFDLIKKIMARERVKIIIVENGEPTMIISDFKEYFVSDKDTTQSKQVSIAKKEEVILPEAKKEEKIFLPKNGNEKELTIDDLPL